MDGWGAGISGKCEDGIYIGRYNGYIWDWEGKEELLKMFPSCCDMKMRKCRLLVGSWQTAALIARLSAYRANR